MSLLLNFSIGFIAALIGVIPPGLLNMSAAKISMTEGRKNGLLFSVGVCITVMLQTYIGFLFSRYLDNNPEVTDLLQEVALGIFICITIYFFFIAKDTRREIPEEVHKSKTNRFFAGILLAMLNLLPVPYWVYISITFAGFGWFSFEQPELWLAVFASGLGTFVMLWMYVQFFKRKKMKKQRKVNMNYVIGAITALISIITAYKIFENVF